MSSIAELVDAPFPIALKHGAYHFVNWARTVDVTGLMLCEPQDAHEVVEVVNWAAANGKRVRVIGHQHNWSPLTVSPGHDGAGVRDVVLMHLGRMGPNLQVQERDPRAGGRPTASVNMGVSQGQFLELLEKVPRRASGGPASAPGFGLAHCPAPDSITLGGMMAIDGHGTAVPCANDKEFLGDAPIYGTYSNRVVSITVVAYNAATERYELRTIGRDEDGGRAIAPFLTHCGRTIVTRATLQVEPNYYMRCRSFMGIDWRTMFAAPGPDGAPKDKSMAWFMERHGRAEAIWYPFTEKPWLKVWTVTGSHKPKHSREVGGVCNFGFSDQMGIQYTALLKAVSGAWQGTNDAKEEELEMIPVTVQSPPVSPTHNGGQHAVQFPATDAFLGATTMSVSTAQNSVVQESSPDAQPPDFPSTPPVPSPIAAMAMAATPNAFRRDSMDAGFLPPADHSCSASRRESFQFPTHWPDAAVTTSHAMAFNTSCNDAFGAVVADEPEEVDPDHPPSLAIPDGDDDAAPPVLSQSTNTAAPGAELADERSPSPVAAPAVVEWAVSAVRALKNPLTNDLAAGVVLGISQSMQCAVGALENLVGVGRNSVGTNGGSDINAARSPPATPAGLRRSSSTMAELFNDLRAVNAERDFSQRQQRLHLTRQRLRQLREELAGTPEGRRLFDDAAAHPDKQLLLHMALMKAEQQRDAARAAKYEREEGRPLDGAAPELTGWAQRVRGTLAGLRDGLKFTPMLGKTIYDETLRGLVHGTKSNGNQQTYDIWGTSRCSLIYCRDTTIRVTANGYAVLCRRSHVALVMHEFAFKYEAMLADYERRGKYPIAMPLEIRVTGLDDAREAGSGRGEAPWLSAVHLSGEDRARGFDCCLWLDVLSLPGNAAANEFYHEMEQWLLDNEVFNGPDARMRPEWSKGWGYDRERGAWHDARMLEHARSQLPEWDGAVDALNAADPYALFTNGWMSDFFDVERRMRGGRRAAR